MTKKHSHTMTYLFMTVILLSVPISSCTNEPDVEIMSVSLTSSDVFEYPAVGGDEDGAMIIRQALHYEISEIRRDSTTRWVAVYYYQPALGFVGMDVTELEIYSGSDGASAPTETRRVAFRFEVNK